MKSELPPLPLAGPRPSRGGANGRATDGVAASSAGRHPAAVAGDNWPALSPVGLRAFFRVAALWRLDTREQAVLLACSRGSIYRWRRHSDRARLHRDRIERISTVLAIHAAVSRIVPDAALPLWLRDSVVSLPWMGRSPLQLMLDGNVSDLLATLSLVEHLAAPAA